MAEAGPQQGILGITGGIGAGKSLLGRILREEQGWPLLDADAMGHAALRPESGLVPSLRARFGPEILASDGAVRREKLAEIVFRDQTALRDLNALVHPWIHARIGEEVAALRSGGYADIISLDAALLLDWLDRIRVDWIVVVIAPEKARLRRLAERGLSGDEIRRRRQRQPGDAEFRARAHWVVENGGSLEDLREASRALAREVRRLGLGGDIGRRKG